MQAERDYYLLEIRQYECHVIVSSHAGWVGARYNMISHSSGDGAFLRNGNLQGYPIAFPIMHLSGDIDFQREY
jgi:hypothetical protein